MIRKAEARHRYWHIQKSDRDFFPEDSVQFKLEFDGNTFEMKINHKDDIMTGQLYERRRFLEGDRIIVSDTQAYRQFGNAVVVPVVTEIARSIIKVLAANKKRTTLLDYSYVSVSK